MTVNCDVRFDHLNMWTRR